MIMKLVKVKLSNYCCFEYETIINMDDFTAFIGNNSSGKTAILSALNKLFSAIPAERNIQSCDFFTPKNGDPEELDEKNLYIETVFTFDDEEDAIPIFFNNFIVDSPQGQPFLRIRLIASWKKSILLEGSVDSKIFYITCPEGEDVTDDNCTPANRHDLNFIRMIYIPAMRNPAAQLKNASGSIIHQIMKSINWSTVTNNSIKESLKAINDAFTAESGVNILKSAIQKQWKKYDLDPRYTNAELCFTSVGTDFAIRNTEVLFSPTVLGRPYSVNELGDGLRSLFYISLVESALDVEEQIRDEYKAGTDVRSFNRTSPVLTIVAVEEPENHIAPHLLGKLISNLENISKKDSAQVIITSHSPGAIMRLEPEQLRYCRMGDNLSATIRTILLPEKISDQYMFIKEAVKAFPELYFAKLVIFGEGDSEELILKKCFEVSSCAPDINGISIVPLGGRHVNHFWKLLKNLEIPFITLLDLDRERHGGGWGRIKYALEQLINNGSDKNILLSIKDGILSDEKLEQMHTWNKLGYENIGGWLAHLEGYNVFFSSPLDIDFMMLEIFKKEYVATIENNSGPQLKIDEHMIKIHAVDEKTTQKSEYKERIQKSLRNILKEHGGGGETYTNEQKELMILYDYFFLGRSKPITHVLAFSNIEDDELREHMPDVLKRVIQHAHDELYPDEDIACDE